MKIFQEEQLNRSDQRKKEMAQEKQERLRVLIDHRPAVIAMGGQCAHVTGRDATMTLEKPFLIGKAITRESRGEDCHCVQKGGR